MITCLCNISDQIMSTTWVFARYWLQLMWQPVAWTSRVFLPQLRHDRLRSCELLVQSVQFMWPQVGLVVNYDAPKNIEVLSVDKRLSRELTDPFNSLACDRSRRCLDTSGLRPPDRKNGSCWDKGLCRTLDFMHRVP